MEKNVGINKEKRYKVVKYKRISSWTISRTSFTKKKRTNTAWFYAIKERKWYGWTYILEVDLDGAQVKIFPTRDEAKNYTNNPDGVKQYFSCN
jgi:hypothetical protein